MLSVGPDADDVADAEDPDHVATVGDDEVPETAGDHGLGGLIQGPVRRGRDQVVGDVIGDAFRRGVEPVRYGPQDVPFCEDADPGRVAIEHDRSPDLTVRHEAGRFLERVVWPDVQDGWTHGIADPHSSPLRRCPIALTC